MATFERGPITISYDDEGTGDPVLLLAPGGMRSTNDRWSSVPWNPREALADRYRLVGMDQRNAGDSWAPVTADDGWDEYRSDQLALLDHLDIERCHLVGMCIGGPFAAGLLTAEPDRFASAVLLQPVGVTDNRDAFHAMFDDWAGAVAPDHPEADDDDWAGLRANLWGGDFVLTATPDELSGCTVPLLVLMGNDLHHPAATSRQIVDAAPNAELIERWKEPEHLADTDAAITDFLAAHPC